MVNLIILKLYKKKTIKCTQSRYFVTVKRKLEEALALREAERKAWDKEKLGLTEEKEKLKSKLLSLSAEKLKVYNEVVQLKKDFGKRA